jgi:hypothetical protein
MKYLICIFSSTLNNAFVDGINGDAQYSKAKKTHEVKVVIYFCGIRFEFIRFAFKLL